MTRERELYPGDEGETWREYRRLVLQELKNLREDVGDLSKDTTKGFEQVRTELAEFKVRLGRIEDDLERMQDAEQAEKPPPPAWQERVLTPPVIITLVVGVCVLAALILGRDEAVAPILEVVPTP